jgi:hypothetical protein
MSLMGPVQNFLAEARMYALYGRSPINAIIAPCTNASPVTIAGHRVLILRILAERLGNFGTPRISHAQTCKGASRN